MLRLMNYLLIVLLSACATTPRPTVEKPSTSDAAEIGSANPLGQVYFKGADIALSEGDIVGLYRGGTSKKGSGHLCNWNGQGEVRWGKGAFSLGDMGDDFRDNFREAVTSRGLIVVRGPVAAVQTEDQVNPTLFAVSANIVEIDANICRLYHWRDGSPLHQANGELSMAVQWAIYLYPIGRRIKSIQTRGHAESIEERESGAKLLLLEAFSDAADRFADSSEVRKILLRNPNDYDLESTPFTY
jgi:hypothetical protein